MVDRSDSERLRGFCDRQTDRQTDICDSRVAFATENSPNSRLLSHSFTPFTDKKRRSVDESHLVSKRGINDFACASIPIVDTRPCRRLKRTSAFRKNPAKLCQKLDCPCCFVSTTNSYYNDLSCFMSSELVSMKF